MNISLILTYFSIASGVLPLLAAWYNYKQLDGVLKLFVVFCIVSVAFDLLDMVLAFLKMQNNSPLLHLYILVSVLFYTVIYYKVFYKAVFKKIALLLGTITLIAMVCSAIFIQYIWTYPSISNTVLSLLMIVLSLTYFYQLLTLQEFVHIDKQGMFWINAGILFYFSINIFNAVICFRLSFECLVQIGYVSLVVFPMVYLHCKLINVRFQSIGSVR